MKKDSILIINDITGYGRVSTFAMLPVMSHYGLHPYILPTALVSNTLDYGTSEMLDTTDFMLSTTKKWDELGFSFNYIASGFITNERQVPIILDLIAKQPEPFVFVDPIMADDGKLYPDMYPGAVECNRRLASYADIIIPNLTEAELLTGLFEGKPRLTCEEYTKLVDALHSLGPDRVIIKGCSYDDDSYFNIVSEKSDGNYTKIPFEKIDMNFIGTGDIFSAVLISEYMSNHNLIEAVRKAADFVRLVILDNLSSDDQYDIHFEQTLSKLSM